MQQATVPTNRSSRLSRIVVRAAFPWPLLAILLAGCSRDIDVAYGRREGFGATASVNGTAVLAKMFEQAGHQVFSWQSLSPRLSPAGRLHRLVSRRLRAAPHEVCHWLDSGSPTSRGGR